jgi:hypothetical protein
MGHSIHQINDDYVRQLTASLARDSFLHFIKFVKPDYQFNWHHLVLIDALQRLADREFQ